MIINTYICNIHGWRSQQKMCPSCLAGGTQSNNTQVVSSSALDYIHWRSPELEQKIDTLINKINQLITKLGEK